MALRRSLRYRCIVALLALGAAWWTAGPAAADDPPPNTATAPAAVAPPSDVAGVAEYVEMIPSSGGGTPADAAPRQHKLPRSVAKALKRDGGKDAHALEQIASSSASNALASQPPSTAAAGSSANQPRTQQPKPAARHRAAATSLPDQAPRQSSGPVRSAFRARVVSADSGSSRFIVLAILLAVSSLAIGGGALLARSRR